MKVRSVFKYASPPPSNLCAATNISKSFPLCPPCALQPPLRSSFLSAGVGRAERRTTASRGRATIITRAGRSPRKRQRAEGREGGTERETDCGDAPSGQSGAGSRNIFENSNHLLETTGSARRRRQRHVSVDTEVEEEEVRRSGPAGGGGGGGQRKREVGPFLGASR